MTKKVEVIWFRVPRMTLDLWRTAEENWKWWFWNPKAKFQMHKKFILKATSPQSGPIKINLGHMYADNLTWTSNSYKSVAKV